MSSPRKERLPLYQLEEAYLAAKDAYFLAKARMARNISVLSGVELTELQKIAREKLQRAQAQAEEKWKRAYLTYHNAYEKKFGPPHKPEVFEDMHGKTDVIEAIIFLCQKYVIANADAKSLVHEKYEYIRRYYHDRRTQIAFCSFMPSPVTAAEVAAAGSDLDVFVIAMLADKRGNIDLLGTAYDPVSGWHRLTLPVDAAVAKSATLWEHNNAMLPLVMGFTRGNVIKVNTDFLAQILVKIGEDLAKGKVFTISVIANAVKLAEYMMPKPEALKLLRCVANLQLMPKQQSQFFFDAIRAEQAAFDEIKRDVAQLLAHYDHDAVCDMHDKASNDFRNK